MATSSLSLSVSVSLLLFFFKTYFISYFELFFLSYFEAEEILQDWLVPFFSFSFLMKMRLSSRMVLLILMVFKKYQSEEAG